MPPATPTTEDAVGFAIHDALVQLLDGAVGMVKGHQAVGVVVLGVCDRGQPIQPGRGLARPSGTTSQLWRESLAPKETAVLA